MARASMGHETFSPVSAAPSRDAAASTPTRDLAPGDRKFPPAGRLHRSVRPRTGRTHLCPAPSSTDGRPPSPSPPSPRCIASSAAEAAGPRPFFQMPFACGQTWEASTYDGHWPDQDSIDLGEWTAGRRQHEPGRAGARLGRRHRPEGLHQPRRRPPRLPRPRRRLGHPLHPPRVDPAAHRGPEGGARASRSAASATAAPRQYHLHYTQLRDGKAVRIAFNGTLINTHAGQSPYSPWGNGEKLTSLNCPMNSFVQFNHTDGKRYQLAYKPGTGDGRHRPHQRRRRGHDRRLGRQLDQGLDPPHPVHGRRQAALLRLQVGDRRGRLRPRQPRRPRHDHDRRGHVVQGLDELHALHARRPALLRRLQPPLRRRERRPHQRGRQRRLDAVVGQLGQGLDAPDALPARRHAVLRRLQERHRRRRDRQDHRRRQQRRDHRGVGGQLGHGLVAPGADDAQRRRAHAALQVDDRAWPRSTKIKAGGLGIQTLGSASWTKSWTTFSPFSDRRQGPLPRLQDRHRQGRRRQAQRGRQRDRPRLVGTGGRLGWA